MATSPLLEAFAKATYSPLDFSSFMLRVFPLSSTKQLGTNHSMVCSSTGAALQSLTHLFFADGSLLFCKANTLKCIELINILNAYEKASSQKINVDKSSAFFSPNTPSEVKEEI